MVVGLRKGVVVKLMMFKGLKSKKVQRMMQCNNSISMKASKIMDESSLFVYNDNYALNNMQS